MLTYVGFGLGDTLYQYLSTTTDKEKENLKIAKNPFLKIYNAFQLLLIVGFKMTVMMFLNLININHLFSACLKFFLAYYS